MMATQSNFPLETEKPWPRNQWWVAALASEVSSTPMQRLILGEPVVLYRTESGEPAAMGGLCPHRGYPMAKGKVVGNGIECGYHGITFDASGACTRIPSQDSVPPRMSIRTYPVVQRWDWIWIWTGDPAAADPAKIPDPWCLNKPGWRSQVSQRSTLKSRYTLLLDNLFDLSHLGFIHASYAGDVTAIVRAPAEMTEQEDKVFRLVRRVDKLPWSDLAALLFPEQASDPQDLYSEVFTDYYGPSLVISGGPFLLSASRKHLGGVNYLHAMTPETLNSCHYFGGITRDFRLDDEAFGAMAVKIYQDIRDQDLDALAEIEPYAGNLIHAGNEISVLQDAGGIRVRRMLTKQIEAEGGA